MVRTDALSMTPGRVAAQVCHAGTLTGIWFRDLIEKYCSETSYPTTIILNGQDFSKVSDELIYHSVGHIEDPSYPVQDGLVTHYVEFLTTYFWLVDDEKEDGQTVIRLLKKFPLYHSYNHSAW